MRFLSLFITICLVAFYLPDAHAVKASARGSVEIVDPVGFSEFSGFKTIRISRSSNIFKRILGASNSALEYRADIPSSEYVISGSRSNSIQIRVFGQDGRSVRVSDFTMNYNGSGFTRGIVLQDAPGRNTSLKLGATLVVAGGTKAGVYRPAFDIGVLYE